MRIFCLTRGPTRSLRNRDAQCCNLATLQTPLATFFPSKKCPNLVSETHRYCHASARTHTSLSLSLSLSASAQRAAERGAGFNSVKQILCCFSNFTCKYRRNHSTAIVFILCVFDFIRRRCDYHDFCADYSFSRLLRHFLKAALLFSKL